MHLFVVVQEARPSPRAIRAPMRPKQVRVLSDVGDAEPTSQ